MPKKSRRPKGRSKKWSRANVMNFALTAVIALSMVLGSIVVFGGATPQPSAPAPTAPIVATAVPPVVQPVPTATALVTATIGVSSTPAAPSPTP